MKNIYLFLLTFAPLVAVTQNVGVGTASPASKLGVKGGLSIGNTYSENHLAPTNGLLVEGNVGIGNSSPAQKLDVTGNIRHSGTMLSRGANYSSVWMQFDEHQDGNSLLLGAGGLTAIGSGESMVQVKANVAANSEVLYLTSDGGVNVVTSLQNGWATKVDAMTIAANGTLRLPTYTTNGLLKTTGGNGTIAIATGADLPSGSGHYIRNQTTSQSSANFNISGKGSIGGSLPADVYGTGVIGLGGSGTGSISQGIIGHQGSHRLDLWWNFYRINTTTPAQYTGIAANDIYTSANGISMGDAGIQFFSTPTMITGTSLPFERMRINNAGNVGVGATNPLTKFHVAGTSATALMRLQNTESGVNAISQSMAGLEIIARGMNEGAAKYTPAIKFGSTDPEFTTTSPKFLAGIVGRGTETYNADATGGMSLDFMTSPNNPGVAPTPLIRMSIHQDGNVGIGTETPGNRLSLVRAAGASSTADFRMSDGTRWMFMNSHSSAGSWSPLVQAGDHTLIYSDGTQSTGGLVIGQWSTSARGIRIAPDGNVGIGINPNAAYKLHVSGQMKSDGFLESSDIRLKKNIEILQNALNKVMQLQGVSYNWKNEKELADENIAYTTSRGDKADIGLIAQEVEKILPQLVSTDSEGFKSVEYSKLVALLIEAMKEQQHEMNVLKKDNAELKVYAEKTNKLEIELSEIKSFLFQQSKK